MSAIFEVSVSVKRVFAKMGMVLQKMGMFVCMKRCKEMERNQNPMKASLLALYFDELYFILRHLHEDVDWSAVFSTACIHDNDNIVKLLIDDKRVRPYLIEIGGFRLACMSGSIKVVKYLLRSKGVRLEKLDFTNEEMKDIPPSIVEVLLYNVMHPDLNVESLLAVINDPASTYYDEYQTVLATQIQQLDQSKETVTCCLLLKVINWERRMLNAPSLARDDAQICVELLFKDGNSLGCLPTDLMPSIQSFL